MLHISRLLMILLPLCVSAAALAEGNGKAKGNPKEKAKEAEADGDEQAIKRCLEVWGKDHPWQGTSQPAYKVLAANVKVLGIGDGVEDKESTPGPKLILVKPTVAVLSKSKMKLLNPKGWYCLKANVTVLSKTVFELACTASLADSREGVAVLGSNSDGTGSGVTVLGKTVIERQGCK